MTTDYLSNSLYAADPQSDYQFRLEIDKTHIPQIYPRCSVCGGIGHQTGCAACHDSGIDFQWIRKMRA